MKRLNVSIILAFFIFLLLLGAPKGGSASPTSKNTPNSSCKKQYETEYPCKNDHNYIYLPKSKTCVLPVFESVIWAVAKEKCDYIKQGNLAIVGSKVMDTELSHLLSESLMQRREQRSSFWIGLHNRHLQSLGQDGFGWLMENYKANYSNLALSASVTKEPRCVGKDSTDTTWFAVDCYTRLYFVCQRSSASNPGPPTFLMHYPSGSNHGWINRTLTASCRGLTDRGAVLDFTIGEQTFNSSHDGFTLDEDGQYINVGDQCFVRSMASLSFLVTSEMFPKVQAFCCWSTDDGFRSCSTPVELKAIYLPQRSNLLVYHDQNLMAGKFLKASCTACVGTNGQLVWSLQLKGRRITWIIDPAVSLSFFNSTGKSTNSSANLEDEGYQVATILWAYRESTACGPKILSTFRRKVSEDQDNSLLSCNFLFPYKMPEELVGVESKSFPITVLKRQKELNKGTNWERVVAWTILLFLVALGIAIAMMVPGNKTKKRKEKTTSKNKPPRTMFMSHGGKAKPQRVARKQPFTKQKGDDRVDKPARRDNQAMESDAALKSNSTTLA